MPSWKKVIVSGSDASLNSLNVATNVVAQSFTGSLLGTSSYAANADFLDGKDSTVFATTGSNIFIGNQTVTGSLFTTGSNTLVGSTALTGSLSITGSTVQVGNNTLFGNTQLTGSIGVSGSQTFVGNQSLTGSFNITGSTFQVGNNTLLGNTVLTGSIIISSSFPVGSLSSSVKVFGDTTMTGYLKFEPYSTNVDTSISASYIFVSGSTNDLYFSQNGNGYSNVTRLRWLEGNLYTGLLHGGLITVTTGSTTFNVSSGSGVIIDLNASIADDPYPTANYLNWGNYTNIPLTYLTSSIQTFVGIDANGQVSQQTTPYVNGEYNTQILIGTVLHQNQATINASITYPSLAYGYKQRTYDFVKAFGPLKLSGLTIITSSSLGLNVGSGTAYADGRNYQTDPNNPSYITDPGTSVSKIFRYYQSGSAFVQDTNGGVGYTVIDPGNYNPGGSGSLTPVPGTGVNREWSIQRIFWYPNSATKGIVVYYGNQTYLNAVDAAANISYESFQEVENTKQNAVYLGALVLRNDATFANSATYRILPGGLFRNVGGAGGGGNVTSLLLSQLGDVTISGPTDGQALVYNSSLLKWVNASAISASITGNAATATTASFATTASYVLNAVSASYAATASSADNFLVRGTLTAQTIVAQTITSSVEYITGSTQFGSLLTNTHQFTGSVSITGSLTSPAITGSLLGTASYATTATNVVGTANRILFNSATDTTTTSNNLTWEDSINLMTLGSATGTAGTISKIALYTSSFGGYGLGVSPAQLDYVSDGSHVFYKNGITPTELVRIANNGDVNITGSLTVINGITGSLLGTASYANQANSASFATSASQAQNATTASYVLNAVSASFATSASQAQNANTASYVLNAVSASFATSASRATSALSSSYAITASYTDFVVSSSYALTASFALSASSAPGYTTNHTQLTASTTWSFNHNLNTRNPLVQVYDLSYNQIVPNEIVGIDAFTTEIRFDYTQAGYAVASNGGGLYATGSTPRLVQTVAATTWSFAHNLQTKYPGFEVFDTNDDVIIPAGIHVVDINNAEIYFATPTAGTVIANFSGINGLSDNAVSASYAATASYSDQFNIGQTQTQYATVTSSINGSNIVFNVATGSYSSAFFKYTVASGSNARSGEIMSVWNGSTVTFTDNSTTDIGTTTAVTSSVAISASNAQLTMQTNTAGWRIKSIAIFI